MGSFLLLRLVLFATCGPGWSSSWLRTTTCSRVTTGGRARPPGGEEGEEEEGGERTQLCQQADYWRLLSPPCQFASVLSSLMVQQRRTGNIWSLFPRAEGFSHHRKVLFFNGRCNFLWIMCLRYSVESWKWHPGAEYVVVAAAFIILSCLKVFFSVKEGISKRMHHAEMAAAVIFISEWTLQTRPL